MRYEKGHKDTTKQRILTVAADRFRKDGIAAAGLAGLMADAGLTHGGFYAHFDSKEDLVRQAVRQAAAGTLERLKEKAGNGLGAVIRSYLSPEHRDDAAQGCVMASLAAELARHPDTTRQTFGQGLEEFIDFFVSLMPEGSAEARRKKAIALFATLAGSLQMARAVPDRETSAAVLAAGIAAAHLIAGIREEPTA